LKRLSKTKKKILQYIWEADKPLTLTELVDKTHLTVRTVRRHLNDMEKTGLIMKSGYFITSEGKDIIGFPPIDEQIAQQVLKKTSTREAFHFYTDYGNPLGVSASSLEDFCKITNNIHIKSLEYHSQNGHFTTWIRFLGDLELAERLNQLRNTIRTGEALRSAIYTVVKNRFDELADELQTAEPIE
jgi:DNA-binding transcriptional regulator YhcF (GntR family)